MNHGLLTRKLTRFIIIFGGLSALLISFIQVLYEHNALKQRYFDSVDTNVNTLMPALIESLWVIDLKQTRLQLQAIGNYPYVSFVKLQMDDFDDIQIGTQPSTDPSLVIEKNIVHSNKTVLAKLIVSLDENMLAKAFKDNFYEHILNNAILIGLTATILYFLLKTLITKRLYGLVEQLRKVAVTDLETSELILVVRAKDDKFDEIDELTLVIKSLWDIRQRLISELIRNEKRWRLALESSSDGLWDWNIATDQVFYSDNWKSMLGYGAEEINEQINAWEKLVHPDDLAQAKTDIQSHLAGTTENYCNSHRMLCNDGSYKWVLARGRVIERDDKGNPLRMVGTHTDIHQLIEAKQQLKIAATVYEQASEGMMVTNEKSEIIDVNRAFTLITGYSADEVKGKRPNILSSGKQSNLFYKNMWNSLVQHGCWKGEICNKDKSGKEYIEWLSISEIRDQQANIQGYVGIFSDITERKQQDELIYHQANYDSLTNLANRRLYLELLDIQINLCKRDRAIFWLIYLDLDNFKEINDTLGHSCGDELLQEWSQRIRTHLRESDIFARIGGDEFAILFSQVRDVVVIDKLANNLVDVSSEPFTINGNDVYISVSLGVVQFPKDGDDSVHLVRAADQTLYKAKQLGRNQHAYYTPQLQEALDMKVNLAKKMRKALEDRCFEVFYQPIVSLSDNKVFKAESLLRWMDSEAGFISPALFIPIAEETGIIDALTEFVVNEVVLQIKNWSDKYTDDMQISINISPIEFRSIHMRKTNWLEELKQSRLKSNSVLFEITEGVLLHNDDANFEQLQEFRKLGIELAIDDFGTGYSSLSYLHKFDIDYLKIDKQFVEDIVTNSNIRALCEAIIVMAHKLGMKVIAEGVETQSQADLLKSLDCDFYQGYLCSPAISCKEFEQRFLTEKSFSSH